ncbi:cation transporter [Ornithinibacillus gellani]|uniref:cation diffusion facilitator family transporter n=1 Tax=Ornithinibacillus gellani TaxID=2293253 RepID=UPI000F461FAB|nr:cation diffusion facilitator family transporter [Ornithinibacillus gellani]TQS76584.1 cation transporter [Ornithinibacillus gellani]
MDQSYENLKKGEKGAWLSIIAYLVLSIVKLWIAYIGNSEALRADGLNNSTDVIASIALLVGLKISRIPPDQDHRYGHYRAETIASLFAAFIMMTVGIQVIINIIQKLFSGSTVQPDLLTAWTAFGSAVIMLLVYRFNLSLSRKINSSAIYAAAQDNRSDALVSLGAFIGIIGAQFGVFWLDPIAGLLVGFIICRTAWHIFKDATHSLTDGFDEKQLEKIKASVSNVSQVKHIRDIKGRFHGNQALIDITILVDPHLDVQESHDITVQVEQLLADKHHIAYTHIHIEPYKSIDK